MAVDTVKNKKKKALLLGQAAEFTESSRI